MILSPCSSLTTCAPNPGALLGVNSAAAFRMRGSFMWIRERRPGCSEEVLKAVDEAQTVVTAVYIVPERRARSATPWPWPMRLGRCFSRCSITRRRRLRSWRWGIRTWRAISRRSKFMLLYVFECDRIGSRGDQGVVSERFSDSRTSAGDDSECGAAGAGIERPAGK